MLIRELKRDEIRLIWQIDRREVIEAVYYLEGGELVLKPEFYDMHGWPPGEAERYTPHLLDCFDHGGTFYGAFDDEQLVGVAILEGRFIGMEHDKLQLKFLHVSRAYRKRGIGRELYALAAQKANTLGAKRLYVSATPSENTVDFSLHRGCYPTQTPDSGLFMLEPEDIHLEAAL
jgi:predicted N-acetyltransferase YhbS